MAASFCNLQCTFSGTQGHSFYFQVGEDETDLLTDSFHKSTTFSEHWLMNKDNFILYVASGDQLVFEDLTMQERCRPDCRFTVNTFNEAPDSALALGKRGLPVTLSTVQGNQYKVVSCADTRDIQVETMESLPETIEDDRCAVLFFMRNSSQCSNSYLFQSAVHKDHVLGFKQVPEQDDDSMHKLVLRPWQEDELDDGCHIDMALCQQT